jgi:hypothetical protein
VVYYILYIISYTILSSSLLLFFYTSSSSSPSDGHGGNSKDIEQSNNFQLSDISLITFIEILISNEIMIQVKDKILQKKYKSITEDLVREAFPKTLPPPVTTSKKVASPLV